MRKKIGQWLSSRSFRFKLMVTSIICILIPGCFSLIMYNYLTQDAVKQQVISNSQESMLLVNNYVTNSLKYMLNVANLIQMDSELSSIVKRKATGQTYTGPNAEYEEFTDQSKIRNTIENITIGGEQCYVTIILSNGSYYSSYSVYDYNPIDMTREPWFAQLNQLYGFNSYWVGASPTVFISEKDKNPYQLSVVRTLREKEGFQIYGYVIVTIMENQMNQNFENLSDSQEFMILDSNNVIMSHNDVDQIGKPFRFATSNQTNKQISTQIVHGDNEDYLLTQEPLFTGWKLVSLTPYQTAINKIKSIFTNVITLQLISFIVFLLLLLYLLRTFTKPLVGLGKVAITVQKGNLDVRSRIRGGDEIGRLGYLFDQMLDRIHDMIEEISVTQTRKRKAELDMLQAQINPHFLFNVLNSIRMKVMFKGDKESAEMIGSLSKLLRMTINQDKGLITLHEEIEIVMDYTQLMNMRQKEKVLLQTDISANALLEKVPRFFLQPLIENALIHGLSQSGGVIRVKAWVEEDKLIVYVEDNGAGMDDSTLSKLQRRLAMSNEQEHPEMEKHKGFSSIGLSNVNERMRMTYGEDFEMKMESELGKGTRITMLIPCLEANE
ncbi:sensor histidine kinase [Paenibacillus sp. RC67]|uniref:cache domain-containing sensor histidine kinase n=1 Tax=Paenibacillus sp. RC67 TaxID=3039392 RepID=UPI0024AE6B85|nr:sensor histidine kinase [Paenibacillus sp. RC67]